MYWTLNFIDITKETDNSWIFVVIFLSILFAFALIVGLTIMLDKILTKKYRTKLESAFVLEKVYVVDLENQKVNAVSIKSLHDREQLTLTEFLSLFVDKEQNKLNVWINELLQEPFELTNENNVFVTDIITKNDKNKKVMLASRIIFRCTKVEKETKKVFLESTYLNNLPSEYSKTKKGDFHKDAYLKSEIARFYSRGDFSKGNIYFIDFYKKGNITTSQFNVYEFRYLILNAIYKKTYDGTSYFSLNDTSLSFTIVDNKAINKYRLNTAIKDYIDNINEVLEIKGFSDLYGFTVCASKTSELGNDYAKTIESLTKLSSLAKDSGKQFMIYKHDIGDPENLEESYKQEISKIIKNSLINIKFSSIFKITNKRVMCLGYKFFASPRQSIFNNETEMKKCAHNYGLDKELFSLIARNVVPTFTSQRELTSSKLFYPISLYEIQYVMRSLSRMSGIENLKLAFIIDNDELIDSENNQQVLDSIVSLTNKGYEVYLKITVGDYVLKNKTYDLFTGFLLDAKLKNNVKADGREFLRCYGYLEKLKRFKKQIISINANSYQEIELLLKNGVSAFSSEIISEASEMLVPINKKVQKRLLNMNKK